MFALCYQLCNVAYQHGIHSIDQLKYDTSACPTIIGDHNVTQTKYNRMAMALYEKVSSYEVISADYLTMRNIVIRYALQHDGYHILYELMEDVHPNLKGDAEMQPPTINKCRNMHSTS